MNNPIDPAAAPPDEAALEHSQRLVDLIRDEAVTRGGLLPFDRFMDLALYAPGLGYYVAGTHKLGPDGDFVTAPELSPLFGRCIAEQCREVLEALGEGDILEFGAGSGALASEVLSALADASVLPRSYLILEPSPQLRERQRHRLAERIPRLAVRVRWLDRLPSKIQGCILANEVLDAMPVHRFRVGADARPRELFVMPSTGRWEEVAAEPVSPGLSEAVCALQDRALAVDPGYESEINLRAGPWIRALAEMLERGLALLIDYGYTQTEYYHPDRCQGTLMCHRRHRTREDPYIYIGLQDITAHVNFTAVAQAGSKAGLRLAGYTTQAHFLLGCGLDKLLGDATAAADALDRMVAAKQLVLPSAMGERFKVLGLDKGMDMSWSGFSFRDLRDRLGE